MNDLSHYSLENVARRLERQSLEEEARVEADAFRDVLGESFAPFDTEANFQRIGNFVESMKWPISSKSLLAAFGILTSRGLLEKAKSPKPEEPASEPVEQPRDEKGRYASADPDKEFREFYDSAPAAKIKARSQTDPAFEKWLRGEIQRNTAHQELPSEPSPAVTLPEPPPAELKAFAEKYHRMPASEVRRNLQDSAFVRAMDEAARAGLI